MRRFTVPMSRPDVRYRYISAMSLTQRLTSAPITLMILSIIDKIIYCADHSE